MKRIAFMLVIFLSLQGCSFYNLFKDRDDLSLIKDGWRVKIAYLDTDEKILEMIYKKNGITPRELETNKLLFVKIEFTNLSKTERDLSKFRYELVATTDSGKGNIVLVDSEAKGFLLPPETGYVLIDKLTKIDPGKSAVGYLPFWIPKESKIYSMSLKEPRQILESWHTFYYHNTE